jgi:hypothetical protein
MFNKHLKVNIMKNIFEFILCLAIFAGWGVMLALGV